MGSMTIMYSFRKSISIGFSFDSSSLSHIDPILSVNSNSRFTASYFEFQRVGHGMTIFFSLQISAMAPLAFVLQRTEFQIAWHFPIVP